MNQAAIDQGMLAPVQVAIPAHWADLPEPTVSAAALPEFIRRILTPMNRQEGDSLPVSAFTGMEDGTFPLGTAAFEKRGIAISVPAWQPEGCTQCNQCAFICPHAAIRPALLTDEERALAPTPCSTNRPPAPKPCTIIWRCRRWTAPAAATAWISARRAANR